MNPYAWIITKDHIARETEVSAVGTIGPSTVTRTQEIELRDGKGTAFRMRDDDGELYYEGKLVGDPTLYDGFGPLDDFGKPNAGCTSIEYREHGAWKAL